MTRSSALKVAAVLAFILSAFNVIVSLPFVMQGQAAVTIEAGPPYFVELLLFVTGIIGLIAAYGVWRQMRWGVVLTVFANLVTALSAAPGILFGPRPIAPIASGVTVLLAVAVIVLCLWRDRRPVAVADVVRPIGNGRGQIGG